MTIDLLGEGDTERAFREVLKVLLDERSDREKKPRTRLRGFELKSSDERRIRDQVEMSIARPETSGVIIWLDVHPRFEDANAAKAFLQAATRGLDRQRVRCHAAQFEFEAWLLPHWTSIAEKLRVRRQPPAGTAESVDRDRPPSRHLRELYRLARPPRDYQKAVDGRKILLEHGLAKPIRECRELASLVTSVLELAGLDTKLDD